MELNFVQLHPLAVAPGYTRADDACMDLRTLEDGWVPAHGSHTFRTGLGVEVPEGYALLVFSRSGHGSKHGVRLSNCVAVIDPGYQGEILVTLHNDKAIAFGYARGDRFAQCALVPMPKVKPQMVAEFSAPSERGTGGFGSSGDK